MRASPVRAKGVTAGKSGKDGGDTLTRSAETLGPEGEESGQGEVVGGEGEIAVAPEPIVAGPAGA